MVWETERVDWSKVQAREEATRIPEAIVHLQEALSEDRATAAQAELECNVLLGGRLYEAALPTTICLLAALMRCTSVSRPYILELLVLIASADFGSTEGPSVAVDLRELCIAEVRRGVATFFDLLENGSDMERSSCIDLLILCSETDEPLKDRVRWYLGKLVTQRPVCWLERFAAKMLDELG